MTKIFYLFGLSILCAIFVHEGGVIGEAAAQDIYESSVSLADVDHEMIESMPETIRALSNYFPAEYEKLIENIILIENSDMSEERADELIEDALGPIYDNYVDRIVFAPDEEIRELINSYKALFHEINTKESWRTCNRVVNLGVYALTEIELDEFLDEIDHIESLRLRAMALGTPHRNSAPRAPTQGDWAAFDNAVLATGLTQNQLEIIKSHDTDEPLLCTVIINRLGVLANSTGDWGARVRMSLAIKMIGR
jgi:hypothetical protein